MRTVFICGLLLFCLLIKAQEIGPALNTLLVEQCYLDFDSKQRALWIRCENEISASGREYDGKIHYNSTIVEQIRARYRAEEANLERQRDECIANERKKWEDFQRQLKIEAERMRLEEEKAKIQEKKDSLKRIEQEKELKRQEKAAEEKAARDKLRAEMLEEARRQYEEDLRRRKEFADNYNAQNRSTIPENYARSVEQGTALARNSIGEVSNIRTDYYQKSNVYASNEIGNIFSQGLGDEIGTGQIDFSKIEEKLTKIEKVPEEDLTALIEEIKRLEAELDAINKSNEEEIKRIQTEREQLRQADEDAKKSFAEMEKRDKELEELLKQYDNSK